MLSNPLHIKVNKIHKATQDCICQYMTNAFPNTLVNIAVWLVPVECLVQQVEVQTDLTSQEPQMV